MHWTSMIPYTCYFVVILVSIFICVRACVSFKMLLFFLFFFSILFWFLSRCFVCERVCVYLFCENVCSSIIYRCWCMTSNWLCCCCCCCTNSVIIQQHSASITRFSNEHFCVAQKRKHLNQIIRFRWNNDEIILLLIVCNNHYKCIGWNVSSRFQFRATFFLLWLEHGETFFMGL